MVSKPSDAGARSFVLLAPSERAVPRRFESVDCDPGRYYDLLAQVQTLRGRIYLEDGAIERDQLIDSRHQLDIDEGSWHLLLVDGHHRVRGCARYREYKNTVRFTDLTVARSALARCRDQGPRLRTAVGAELQLARRLELPYVELGGWAIDQPIRGTMDALKMAMATYSLAQSLGGAVGISTVTQRHSSASILRRLGGQVLEEDGRELPPYYDPEYKCGMEVLRFYSWAPSFRYAAWVTDMANILRATTVVCRSTVTPAWFTAPRPAQIGSFALAPR